jgi:YebC/PmpR family DNA-binding regulatory protein
MAGHSKWANIKHRKGEQDRKRAKIFNRISKEIIVAARDGGPDPEDNPPLRTAIQNAKGANMPKEKIERAIKKGTGDDQESQQLQYATYEGYAQGGVGIVIEALTDNINRTVADVRSTLTKHGGSLAKNGSLEPIFEKKGVFTISKESMGEMDKESFEMELIDGGAEDVVEQDEHLIVYTDFKDFGPMRDKLEEMGIESKSAKVERVPITNQALDVEDANKVLRLVDKLEDLDDVNTVYHNLELTEELQAELENS